MSKARRTAYLSHGAVDKLGSASDLRPNPRLYMFKVNRFPSHSSL